MGVRAHTMKRSLGIAVLAAVLLSWFVGYGTIFGQTTERRNQLGGELTCPVGISIVMPVRGVVFEPDLDQLELDVTVCNGSEETQQANFEVEGVPDDWRVALRPIFGPYDITSLTLPGGVSKDFRLRLTPFGRDVTQEFVAQLRILSSTGELLGTEEISVERGPTLPGLGGDILVRAQYSALRGPSTSQFGFDIAITNRTSDNVSLNLGAEVPENWTVGFTPSIGEKKLISSVTVITRGIERVTMNLSPPREAPAGNYNFLFRIGNEEFFQEVPVQVSLTGVPEILVTTPDRRLNIDATAGKATIARIRIVNAGTAEMTDLDLLADAPANWDITFDPDDVPLLPVDSIIDISVSVTPPGDSVPGDYAISVRARNPLVDEAVNFRVTVSQATIWQWVGIGLLIVVLGGLVGLFLRLGRR